jgi:NADH-ubiquinone oxidoreductase chain 1
MIIQIAIILIWTVAILLCVALLTLLERKLLGSLQRRLGPDTVGYVGILQPIADAVKLITKQTSSTHNSTFGIFYTAPMWALVITLIGWGLVTRLFTSSYSYHNIDNTLIDNSWLAILAVLSLTIYSALLLGWSANSSYSLVGSLRSSSALISYELILATSALMPMIITSSYNLIDIVNNQVVVMYLLPMLPIVFIFLISVLAETSRTPFDLIEAESELVSGYMTEHASVAFVLLFLTEYASILLFSAINTVLWLGPTDYIKFGIGLNVILTFIILMRAVLPRIRYDQLIMACWLILLPIIFTIAVFVPSLTYVLL